MAVRTTLEIDDAKLRELMRLLDLTTKTEAIDLAIDEAIRTRKRARLVDLAGKVEIAEDWRPLRDRER